MVTALGSAAAATAATAASSASAVGSTFFFFFPYGSFIASSSFALSFSTDSVLASATARTAEASAFAAAVSASFFSSCSLFSVADYSSVLAGGISGSFGSTEAAARASFVDISAALSSSSATSSSASLSGFSAFCVLIYGR